MGLFSKSRSDRREGAAPSSGAAADQAQVALRDPGLPQNDLRQMVHTCFQSVGLSLVVYGRGSVDECYDAIRAVASTIAHSTAHPNGLGYFAGQESLLMSALTSGDGSAIAVFALPGIDSNFMTDHLMMPIRGIRAPWAWALGISDGLIDSSAAGIIDGSQAVPIWNIRDLSHLEPVRTPTAQIPPLMHQGLVEAGWEKLEGALYKVVLTTTTAGRSQVVLFGQNTSTHFALSSPIAESPDGTLPPVLRGKSFGDYGVMLAGGLVLLVKSIPAGPPSPRLSDLAADAMALADFADRVEADLSKNDDF